MTDAGNKTCPLCGSEDIVIRTMDICQTCRYLEVSRPIKRKVGAGKLRSAVEIVERLAAWSRKYPQNVVHSSNLQKEYEQEILAIENAAKEFVNNRIATGS